MSQTVIGDMLDGAIAGAIATWAMGKVTSALYAHENEQAKQRENDARGSAPLRSATVSSSAPRSS